MFHPLFYNRITIDNKLILTIYVNSSNLLDILLIVVNIGIGEVKRVVMIEFVKKFDTNEKCLLHLAEMRWAGKIVCPHCQKDKIYYFKDGIRYKCATCKRQFNAKTRTIFQDTKVSMPKWYLACYLLTSHKKGISSIQLSKDIGVTQATAWAMLTKIRSLFSDETVLAGVVELDETYVGGLNKNRHPAKRLKGTQGRSIQTKSPVLGIMQRGGKTKAIHVPDIKAETLLPLISHYVKSDSEVMTDEYHAYKKLPSSFNHQFCSHSTHNYVVGDVHTNGLENFWSQVKRTILGIYHWTSKKYLQLYLDESAFRYNTRDMTEQERVDHLFKIGL